MAVLMRPLLGIVMQKATIWRTVSPSEKMKNRGGSPFVLVTGCLIIFPAQIGRRFSTKERRINEFAHLCISQAVYGHICHECRCFTVCTVLLLNIDQLVTAVCLIVGAL